MTAMTIVTEARIAQVAQGVSKSGFNSRNIDILAALNLLEVSIIAFILDNLLEISIVSLILLVLNSRRSKF